MLILRINPFKEIFVLLLKYRSCLFLFALIFSSVFPAINSNAQISDSTMQEKNIDFIDVSNQKIKDCFLEVYNKYESLHRYEIKVVQKSLGASTMQAQPILSLKSLLTGVKSYQVKLGKYVKDSDKIKVSDLPRDVLIGWFAHELGHIVDYQPRSNVGMMIYGIRYLTSKKFKRKVEHDADNIAIENGFAVSILDTKRYILENDFLGEDYKSIIEQYYMSINDVEIWMDEHHAPVEPKIEM